MDNVFLCFLKQELDEEIEFKKIGLKIRNINNEEINSIKYKIESLYCSEEQLELFKNFHKAKNLNKSEKDIEIIQQAINTLNRVINELDDEKRNALLFLERNNGIFDKKIIKNNLKNLVVIEINDEQYKKCFGVWATNSVISRIINFANYLGKNVEMKNFNIVELENFNDYSSIVNSIKYSSFDNITMKKMSVLLNKKDINFNSNFVFMIESFLINNISFENKIINMVSIIEKLLINKNDNKQESFKLKVGVLICKDVAWSYDRISKILKLIYELRSLLVHGEEDEIYKSKDRYADVFDNSKLKNITNKIEVRYKILLTVASYLEIITILTLNKYLDDTEFCEYLKLN